MKKIIYLAPALLLGLAGKGAMADQNTHISRLDEGLMTSLSEPQLDQAANENSPNQEQVAQNNDVKANETKKTVTPHINSLDSNIIEDNAKANKANEIKHAATHVNSLDNNNAENNKKVVQYNTFGVKANIKTASNFIESKIADDNGDQHTIKNPNNNQIIIHYVDENGATIARLKDYTIDINSAPKGNSTGQFKVPDNRYVLSDPASGYQLQHDKHIVHHDAVTHSVDHDIPAHYENRLEQNGYDWVNTAGYDGNTGEWVPEGASGWSATNDEVMNNRATSYSPHYDMEQVWVPDTVTTETIVDKPAYDETVINNVFSSESKNIKSVIGNIVNVILKHGTRNVDANNSDIELNSWRKLHAINSNNQSNLTNKSVKFKVGYTFDFVSLAKVADLASYKAVSNPNDFISENNLTDPVGFSTINNKLLSISL